MSEDNVADEIHYLSSDEAWASQDDWQQRMDAVNQEIKDILLNEINTAEPGKYSENFRDIVLEGFTVQSITLDNGRNYVYVGLNDGTGFVLDDQNGIVRPSEQPEIIEQIFAEPEEHQSKTFDGLLASIDFTPLELPCQDCKNEMVSSQAIGEKSSPIIGIA